MTDIVSMLKNFKGLVINKVEGFKSKQNGFMKKDDLGDQQKLLESDQLKKEISNLKEIPEKEKYDST